MVTQPLTMLLAIRHGETVWNAEQRFQGHGDSPLTELGRNQARALGQRLKKIDFDMLISSDLGRAQETASIISQFTGHSITIDSRLRERNYGVLEGLTFNKIKAKYSDVFDLLISGDPKYKIPEGESHQQQYERNVEFLEESLKKRTGKKIAIVIHGGVLDNVFRYIVQLPLNHPRCVLAANASLSIISHGNFYGSICWVINSWGESGHLNGLGNQ